MKTEKEITEMIGNLVNDLEKAQSINANHWAYAIQIKLAVLYNVLEGKQ